MSADTKKWNANFEFHLFSFLFLVLLSEVLLVYTTYYLTKSQLSINCEKSCTENEIWEVLNSEKFAGIIKEKFDESFREIKNGHEPFLNTKKNPDSIIIRTRRDNSGVIYHTPQGYTLVNGRRGYSGSPSPSYLSGLPGPAGPPGPPGSPGVPGKDGSPGQPGFPGIKGEEGARGYPGLSGIPGARGDTGMPGFPGSKGDEGSRGYPGLSGIPGAKGEVGMPGMPGFPGIKGDEGSRGYPGLSGIPGTKGEVGMSGMPGFPGTKGDEGSRGYPGLSGIPGAKGEVVLPSLSGSLGTKGDKGEPGAPGLPGKSGLPGPIGPPGPKGNCASDNPSNELKIKFDKYGSDVYPDLLPKKQDNIISHIGELNKYNILENRIALSELLLEKATNLIWEARDGDSFTLLEYYDLESFSNKNPYRAYDLFLNFDESNKVIYDRHFYYKSAAGRPAIIGYSLDNNTVLALGIPGLTTDNLTPLYKSTATYFDFNVDENGLWLIFAVPYSNNTGILKINTNNRTIENSWNITLDHTKFDEMFIASGILYTLQFSDNLKIATALDLYKQEYFIMDLDFKEGPTSSDIKAWYEYRHGKLYILSEAKSEPLQYEYTIHFKILNPQNL